MDREDGLNKMTVCKEVCCSLTMLLVGLTFGFIIAMLAYFTYQTAVGSMVFCTFWTDIPGRLAIFIICYYVASICGYLPIPQRYRLNWFPEPFTLWRLQSWRNLFRNLCFPSPSSYLINRLRTSARGRRDSLELPLFREQYEERFHDSLPLMRRRSAPVRINYPDTYITPVFISPSESPKAESPDVSKSSNESFMSFDSPIGGVIVPMVKGKSSKPRYLSDSSISSTESSNNQAGAAANEGTGVSANERARRKNVRSLAAGNKQRPQPVQHIPPGNRDTELELPIYPRFPWGMLRYPERYAKIARVLHRRNLQLERRAIERFNMSQRREIQRRTEELAERGAEGELVTGNVYVRSMRDRQLRTETERIIVARRAEAPTGAESRLGCNRGQREIPRTELPVGRGAEGRLVTGDDYVDPMPCQRLRAETEREADARRSEAQTGVESRLTSSDHIDPTANRPVLTESEKVAEGRAESPAKKGAEAGLVAGNNDAITKLPLRLRRKVMAPLKIELPTETADSGLTTGNVIDPAANRRRPLPSQRFRQRSKTSSHRKNTTTSENVDNLHEFRLEIHRKGDSNLSHRKTQSEAGPSTMSEPRQKSDHIEPKEEVNKRLEFLSNLQSKMDRLKAATMRLERNPQTDTGISGMSKSGQNIEAGRQTSEITSETADRRIGFSAISANPTQVKPDAECYFTPPSDVSKDDYSDSSSEDDQN